MSDPWHVIITGPNAEPRACVGLVGRRYRAYAPTIIKTVRGIERKRPLFPGYIFATISDHDFMRVRSIPGVIDVLRIDTVPATLPDAAIDAIRAKEAEIEERRQAFLARRSSKDHGFRPGQSVRITSGPFAGIVDNIELLDGAHRVRILYAMFGRATPISVDVHEIEAVEPEEAEHNVPTLA